MRSYSTRLLLTAASIGVAGGLVAIPFVPLTQLVYGTFPIVYGLLIVPYLLPLVIVQQLFRAPGITLVTGVIAGLVVFPFSPATITLYLFVAVPLELTYAAVLWRRWSTPMAYLATLSVGVVYTVSWMLGLDAERFYPLLRLGMIAVLIAGLFLGTAVALRLVQVLRTRFRLGTTAVVGAGARTAPREK